MVVCPLITIPLVTAIHYFGQSTIGLAADPAFFLVIGLLSAMPTAISLTQIAQVGRGESLLLRALFWGYGVLCLPFCTLTFTYIMFLYYLQASDSLTKLIMITHCPNDSQSVSVSQMVGPQHFLNFHLSLNSTQLNSTLHLAIQVLRD
jgi:hypothetical protein